MTDVLAPEWLETDGLGGYASGGVDLVPSRKYHGLLISSQSHPIGRKVLVAGAEISVKVHQEVIPLTSFRYKDGTLHPNPANFGVAIRYINVKGPEWEFTLPDGSLIQLSLLMKRGESKSFLKFKCSAGRAADFKIIFRPFLAMRDIHSLRTDSGVTPQISEQPRGVSIRFDNLDVFICAENFKRAPIWFHNILYANEKDRGYDFTESLFSPGAFEMNFRNQDVFVALSGCDSVFSQSSEEEFKKEFRRRDSLSRLQLSAEQFIVRRERVDNDWRGSEFQGTAESQGAHGLSIIAGYPWFSDWGRDTLIASRGLLVAMGQINLAADILKTWGATIRRGLIANTFAESGKERLYNSADAALWFVILAHEVNQLIKDHQKDSLGFVQVASAVRDILEFYIQGTDFDICMDDDALLKAGDGKSQVTWMDAKVGDVMVTPRTGKPVEIQALWINALRVGNFLLGHTKYLTLAQKAEESFNRKFWNQKDGSLYDVIDIDGLKGQNDDTVRSNQIFACGGLIWPIVPTDRSRVILRVVEEQLLTPMGLRTLSPNTSGYLGRYNGSQPERDLAYHQGSVWPWTMGAFVDAWLRVREYSDEAKIEARERFAYPLERYFSKHASLFELADGDPPHTPRGCPFQAWSLGEMVRIFKMCEVGKEPSNN